MWDIKAVDAAEITIVVDNMVGGVPRDVFSRITFPTDWVAEEGSPRYLWAGHGLSVWVSAIYNRETKTILYDTGPSNDLIAHNVHALALDTEEIDEIVMSHGHWDHFGGLRWILEQVAPRHVPVHVHPRMFYPRSVFRKLGNEERRRLLPNILTEEEIVELGGKTVSTRRPKLLQDSMFLVSGEVPRETSYERGYYGHQIFMDGEWREDRGIIDDRCLILNVKNRGLVIVSGCSHAGIVNMTRLAIRLTGVEKIAAIIGGLHLSSAGREKIEATARDIKELSPEILLVGHCTGWRALKAFANEMPQALFPSAVGTRLTIQSEYIT